MHQILLRIFLKVKRVNLKRTLKPLNVKILAPFWATNLLTVLASFYWRCWWSVISIKSFLYNWNCCIGTFHYTSIALLNGERRLETSNYIQNGSQVKLCWAEVVGVFFLWARANIGPSNGKKYINKYITSSSLFLKTCRDRSPHRIFTRCL